MKHLLLLLYIGIISFSVQAQNRVLIADETYISTDVMGNFSVITHNEEINHLINDSLYTHWYKSIVKKSKKHPIRATYLFRGGCYNDVFNFLGKLGMPALSLFPNWEQADKEAERYTDMWIDIATNN